MGLGWFYPDVVAEAAPDRDPLRLLNASLLYGAIGLIVGRFFLQRSAGSAAQPYRTLPIRDGQLVRLLQLTSALSLFNLLPIVVLTALWGSTVWPATDPAGAALWAAGALLTVALTQFANSLLRAAWDRNPGFVIGGAVAVVLAEGGTHAAGGEGLRTASRWLFGGLSAGGVLPFVVLGVATAGTAWAAHQTLRARLYDVLDQESASTPFLTAGTGLHGQRWGAPRPGSLALLDVKLILRNKRPRQMILAGLLIVGSLLLATVPQKHTPPFNVVLFGFILGGYLGVMYGQYGFAWHGHHFDGLLTKTRFLHKLVYAQCVIFAGLAIGSVALILPVVALFNPDLLVPIGAFLLYNLGVTAPILIGLGTWARNAIALGQSSFFNHQGTSTYHFVVMFPIMGLPLGLTPWLGVSSILLLAAGLGGLGIAAIPLWTRWIGELLHRQRHAMAAGFRNTN